MSLLLRVLMDAAAVHWRVYPKMEQVTREFRRLAAPTQLLYIFHCSYSELRFQLAWLAQAADVLDENLFDGGFGCDSRTMQRFVL